MKDLLTLIRFNLLTSKLHDSRIKASFFFFTDKIKSPFDISPEMKTVVKVLLLGRFF